MFKKLFLLSLFFIILLYFNPTLAHVLHYQNLNKLEFDLYRNNQLIGQHIYLFNRNDQYLTVHNKINLSIKVLGVTVYRYSSEGQEIYIDGKFEPKSILPLSLSYDHRLIDGADGAAFINWIEKALEDPYEALLN